MPSKSKAQHNMMAMVAHDPAAAKRLGISQAVGKEFVNADKGRKFSKGGEMKESKAMEMRHVAAMKKAGVPKKIVREEQAEANAMKRGGFVRSADGIAQKGKTKAKQIAMCGGGKLKK
jgi:putative NIF3 family GTP cyclohydrolase 1 type 2